MRLDEITTKFRVTLAPASHGASLATRSTEGMWSLFKTEAYHDDRIREAARWAGPFWLCYERDCRKPGI